MPKVNLQYQVDLNTLMSFCKEEKKEKKKKNVPVTWKLEVAVS